MNDKFISVALEYEAAVLAALDAIKHHHRSEQASALRRFAKATAAMDELREPDHDQVGKLLADRGQFSVAHLDEVVMALKCSHTTG